MLASTSRLPADHLISGALLGAMTGVALSVNSKNFGLNVVNSALKGGIAGGFSIIAANQIVKKEYANAFASVVIGSSLLVAGDYIFSKISRN